MADEIITSTETSLKTLTGNDDYFLLEGVTHYTTGTSVNISDASGNFHLISVFGTLISFSNYAIQELSGHTSGSLRVEIGTTGTVRGGAGAIQLSQDNIRVQNDGLIQGWTTMSGDDTKFINSGTVNFNTFGSGSAAVYMNGEDEQFVNNTGTINSAQIGINLLGSGTTRAEVFNSGTITADQYAIFNQQQGGLLVNNTGTIIGSGNSDQAIYSSRDDNELINSGTIHGNVGVTTSAASTDSLDNTGVINGYVSLSQGVNTVTNSGDINGRYIGGDNSDTIHNTGTINGALVVHNGTNTLNNSGTVQGSYTGGTGLDTVTNTGTIFSDIDFAGGSGSLTNHGIIAGTVGGQPMGADTMMIANTGTGQIGAVDFSSATGKVTIYNAGQVGDVETGSADDMLDFRGGISLPGATIQTGSGADLFEGGDGREKVYDGSGNDVVYLGGGNDYVRAGGGVDEYHGGDGWDDYISYYDSSNGVKLDLRSNVISRSWANNDTISGFESAGGSKTGDDDIRGTDGANRIKTYGGDDKLYGRGGHDLLYGGAGKDRFDGGHGTDDLYGGTEADTFHFDRGEGDDRIMDFENNIDTIEFDNFSGLSTAADALAMATEIGNDVYFDFGSDGTLYVLSATKAQLLNDISIV